MFKIVKYNYPLIVLGYTDLKRQFFPVCFMFNSHEAIEDFDHFFDSMKKLGDQFNFVFELKFLVSDA